MSKYVKLFSSKGQCLGFSEYTDDLAVAVGKDVNVKLYNERANVEGYCNGKEAPQTVTLSFNNISIDAQKDIPFTSPWYQICSDDVITSNLPTNAMAMLTVVDGGEFETKSENDVIVFKYNGVDLDETDELTLSWLSPSN